MEQGFQYSFDKDEVNLHREKRRQTDGLASRSRRSTVLKVIKKTAKPRKNRPFRSVRDMSLQCCIDTCLLDIGREIIMQIRSDFDRMLYQSQNEHLAAHIEMAKRKGTGKNLARNVIRYCTIDADNYKLKVCKQAFMKIYGIGKKRIQVLLTKRRPFSGVIEKDRRIINKNQRRLGPRLKAEVVEHIWSYQPQQSHYSRNKTPEKRYLDPKLNMSKLYKDFLKLKGHLPGTRPALSIASFRKIFLSLNLSFRRPRKDTCGKCDAFQFLIKHSTDPVEVTEARSLQENHWIEAEKHFDQNYFDSHILLPKKNSNRCDWSLPPLWPINQP